MSDFIRYTDEQYAQLCATYRQWWKGELKRPIVPIVTYGHETKMAPTKAPLLAFDGIKGIQWQPGDGTAMSQNRDDARRYADTYGIELDMGDGQGKEDSPLLTAKYRWE